jgi:hypothetical protein
MNKRPPTLYKTAKRYPRGIRTDTHSTWATIEASLLTRESERLLERCCYKTVDFSTAAPQNGVFITQGKCHKII